MTPQKPAGEKQRPIIVKKKVSGHGGHHGGAWKVAYADFVTAMMAFFMVMWIMGMEPTTKDLIQGYFQNPVGFKHGYGAGTNPMSTGNSMTNDGIRAVAMTLRQEQYARFSEAATRIKLRIAQDEQLTTLRDNFEVTVTSAGLRIEVIDGGKGDVFFELGSSVPRPALERALALISDELVGLENGVVLEGHTDALPYGRSGYSNWELSADRANSARTLLVGSGVQPARILEVRGYADRKLRIVERPTDAANRRVSILLPFEDSVPSLTRRPADSLLLSRRAPVLLP